MGALTGQHVVSKGVLNRNTLILFPKGYTRHKLFTDFKNEKQVYKQEAGLLPWKCPRTVSGKVWCLVCRGCLRGGGPRVRARRMVCVGDPERHHTCCRLSPSSIPAEGHRPELSPPPAKARGSQAFTGISLTAAQHDHHTTDGLTKEGAAAAHTGETLNPANILGLPDAPISPWAHF